VAEIFITPRVWCLVFSRVCRTWRTVAYSNELWHTVSRQLLDVVPSLESVHVDGYLYGYIGREWCKHVYLHCDSPAFNPWVSYISQVATLHIPSVMRAHNWIHVGDIRVDSHGFVIRYTYVENGHFAFQVVLDSEKTRYDFFNPLRHIVEHGTPFYPVYSIMWSTPQRNLIASRWVYYLAKKRKNR
jgi:hypothetical protein